MAQDLFVAVLVELNPYWPRVHSPLVRSILIFLEGPFNMQESKVPWIVSFFQRRDIFYGWVVLAVASFADLVTVSLSFSFAVLMKPMSGDMGWGRGQLSLAQSFRQLINGFLAPILGVIVDKHGARGVMVIGAAIGGLAVFAIQWVDEIWQFLVLFGMVGALGFVAAGGFVTAIVVSKWFVRKRGRAMGILTFGLANGGTIGTPVAGILNPAFGWRTAWAFMGVFVWTLILIPVAIFMRRKPEDFGMLPDGDQVMAAQNAGDKIDVTSPDNEVTWTLKEAFKTKTLWAVVLVVQLSQWGSGGIFIHEPAFFTDRGYSDWVGTLALTGHGFFAAIFGLLVGFVVEKVPVRYCMAAILVGCSLATIVMLNENALWMVFFSTGLLGGCLGAWVTLQPMIWANYFGRQFVGTIRGATMPFNIFSMFMGPAMAGFVYDRYGSYTIAFTIYIIAWFLASIVMFLARPPVKAAMEKG